MRLPEGFVIGGQYRIVRLLAAGSKFRIYEADTDAHGPGSVVVKVARHDELSSLAGLEAGRARVHREWDIQKRLHEGATSAAPLPIELVQMYPGDPEVRRIALLDKSVVRSEPYLISEMADGLPLSAVLAGDAIDEERALLIALRVVLLIRSARELGVQLRDFAPSNFVVDTAGENVSIVGFGSIEQPEDWHDYSETGEGQDRWKSSPQSLPLGFGRLLVGLLAGMTAPEWGNTDDDLPRWERLLVSRRVPPEFGPMVLGSLGYFSRFEGTIDAVENRIRAFVGSPHPVVHEHPARARDAPYLIANGERLADRFEVTRPLGQGGRGFVYRAIDRTSGVEVLIKANKYIYDSGSAFATELPTRRLELEHEYDVLKRFSSQTGMLPQPVALLHGRGRGSWFDLAPDLARNEPYVVMEYIKGIPLLDLLPSPLEGYAGATDPNNRLLARLVCRLVAQIADLLSRFHDQGFLYQDLKPENVLYDPRAENVYMVDFAGACPRLPNGQLDKNHVAFGVQTHGFAAPEFAKFWEDCDDRFDIYSLGATAYHLATGVNPERVAMESGEEYPALSLSLLNTIAPPLATLIARCIAPLPDRLPSAEAVRELAESARLQLSRSRPLDVRHPKISYTEDGVQIGWTLPPDPRVTSLRVRRYGEGEEDSITVYSGKVTEAVVDAEPAVDDQFYLVETGYERDGRAKHSRGRIVRAEAHPPPVRFEVEPYFGGNRLRAILAPQATGLAVRFASDGPPIELTDGEILDASEGETFHSVDPGTTVHYAAFAEYGSVASAPRFGTATAVEAVEPIGDVEVRQTSDGVVIRWERPSSNVIVQATRGSETARVPVPADANQVVDLTPKPGEEVRYTVRLTRGGVISDPVADVSIRRWPELPTFDMVPLPGAVQLQAATPLDSRVDDLSVVATNSDGDVVAREELAATSLPAIVRLPGNESLTLTVEARVDGGGRGPRVVHQLVVPPEDASITADAGHGEIPIAISARLPAGAGRWGGTFRWTVWADERVIDESIGGIAQIFVGEAGGLVRTIVDEVPRAADEVVYRMSLRNVLDDEVTVAELALRALERLNVPEVTASLGAVTVVRGELTPADLSKADVRIVRGDAQEVHERVTIPHRISLTPGEQVSVSWRRSTGGDPMPWSAPVDAEALARPPAPDDVGASLVDSMVTVAWSPISLSDTQYVVRDSAPTGTTLYVGPFAQFRDVSGASPKRYAVSSLRYGLESDPVVVASPAAVGARSTSLVPVTPERRVRGLRPSADRLAQCVRVSRRGVAEIHGPARPRLIAVLEGRSEADLDRAVGELHAPNWQEADGLVALAVFTSRRGLVPWPRGRSLVRILEAPLELQRPDWRIIAASIEPTEGTLVGAVESDGKTLTLRPSSPPTALAETDALVVYRRNGTVARRLLRAGGVPAHVNGDIELAGVEALLAASAGLALDTANPSILVAATHAPNPSMFRELIWQDVARGFPLFVAQRLEAEWQSPVASIHPGNPLVLHYLRDGNPVELSVACHVANARGRAVLTLTVATIGGRASTQVHVSLSRPSRYVRAVRKALAWLRKIVAEAEAKAPDLAALI